MTWPTSVSCDACESAGEGKIVGERGENIVGDIQPPGEGSNSGGTYAGSSLYPSNGDVVIRVDGATGGVIGATSDVIDCHPAGMTGENTIESDRGLALRRMR